MDQRIIRTKDNVKKALIELMKKKNIKKITVTDISKYAKINRGTFYLHYEDIYDMIDKVEKNIINDIIAIVKKDEHYLVKKFYYYPILEITNYAKQNKEFLKQLMGDNGDLNFIKKVKNAMMEIFYQYCSPIFKQIEDPLILSSAGSFIISGAIGCFEDWINTDCFYPASKVIKELEKLIIQKIETTR